MDPIITEDTLTWKSLLSIIRGESRILRVPEYCGEPVRKAVIKEVLETSRLSKYPHEPSVAKVGAAFVENRLSSDRRAAYFGNAIARIRKYRSWCGNAPSPFDKLRLELDELVPSGANLARFSAGTAFAGLIRVFEDGGFGAIHQDRLKRADPEERLADILDAQLALNIHLQTATSGGELEVWDFAPDLDEYVALRKRRPGGISRDDLPANSVTFHAKPGDLVIFNSANMHAVKPVTGETRITWSAFAGYVEGEGRMVLWS